MSGRVADLLKYETLFLEDSLKEKLDRQFDLLSNVEKKVIRYLGTAANSATIASLVQELEFSLSEILNAMQSLERRSLIEKIAQDQETLFAVQPVIKQYLQSKYPEKLG